MIVNNQETEAEDGTRELGLRGIVVGDKVMTQHPTGPSFEVETCQGGITGT